MSRRSIPGLPVVFLIIVLGLCFGLSLGSVVFAHGDVIAGHRRRAAGVQPAWFRCCLAAAKPFDPTGSAQVPWEGKLLWVGLCLVGGIYLVVTIPWTAFPKDNEIRLTATGRMNPAAQGNEVWLASITTDRQVFSTRLWRVCSPGWRIVEGNIVSPEIASI